MYMNSLNRRQFITTTIAAALLPHLARSVESKQARHLPAQLVSAPDLPLTNRQRPPFGWRLVTVSSGAQAPVALAWPDWATAVTPTHFRIAIGLDERDEKTVEVFLPQSGRVVGRMELRFVSQFQVYQLSLTANDVTDLRREGLALRLTKGSDLEVFIAGEDVPAALLPHLLVPGKASAMEEFFARLNSLACVQQFGWMEGCVLDGLLDLGELPAHAPLKAMARKHLALFFSDERLIYENHLSVPADGRIYGIEGSLPFAALARVEPRHALHELALAFWESRQRPNGSIQDGGSMTSEGAYTVGYALAEVARARQSDELMRRALTQVRVRQARLFDGREFWRTYSDNGRRGNRNWARGIAWQILGLTRTLAVAKNRDDIADLIIHLQRFAQWAIAQQRPDGLWSVFADEPTLTPDTAGSAGIAAALAIGVKHGWLDDPANTAARKSLAGLQSYLTPDGFLGGVSQSNKGGEALQRSDNRSLYQMGMGLMAQLIAALSSSQS